MKDFLLDSITNKNFDILTSLQDRVFDFNSFYFKYYCKTLGKDVTVSTVAAISQETGSLGHFKELYQSDSYQKLPEEVRTNNDYIILEHINELNLMELISLSNFKVTDEKLDIIIKKTRESYETMYSFHYEEYRDNIWHSILYKSTNKKEYKDNADYAKRFLEETNIEKEKKEERSQQVKEDERLEQKRSELSNLLFMLNDAALEGVPAKTKIENIQFKVKAKK